MAVTPDEAAEALRRRAQRLDETARARAARLRAHLPEAAALLRARGATQVWLFGSLARGGTPHLDSDVDLAVAGLPSKDYFDALAALMALFETRVDLVALERAPNSLGERVRATGEPL